MDSDFFIPGGLFEDDESMQSMSGINPGAREFRPTEPEPRARRAQSADAPPPAFAGGGLLSPSQLGAAAAALGLPAHDDDDDVCVGDTQQREHIWMFCMRKCMYFGLIEL